MLKSTEKINQTSEVFRNIGGKKIFAFCLLFSVVSSYAQLAFQKVYGGAGTDYAYSGQMTSDGGYIFAGETSSFGAGGYDFYLVKTNASGDTLWTKTFGGTGTDEGHAVQQTTDGGYIIAGVSNSFGAAWNGVYLVKIGRASCRERVCQYV